MDRCQNNVVDHSGDDVPDFARFTVKIALFQGEGIVEHVTGRLEGDAVLFEVAVGFGGIPLKFLLSIMYGLPVVLSSRARPCAHRLSLS
jgi:hypothetical protein